MAMVQLLHSTHFGNVSYPVYLCEKAGDELPLHDHTFNHLTFCIAGEIECFTESGRSIKLKPGDKPVEYKAGKQHGIRGLTDGAMFMNTMPIMFGEQE